MKFNFAVVGATGMVGKKIIEILEEKDLPIKNIYFYASKRSAGSNLKFKGKDYTVIELLKDNIIDKEIDFALFSAGGDVSLKFAPIFSEIGATVIDNSSAWRMDSSIPLVVPEVNPEDISLNNGIIANPNCSTIQAVVALKPLYDEYGIKRVIYSTYQAVSGAGVGGHKDLMEGYKGKEPETFSYPIVGNVIPQIDDFLDNGYTKEEMKMINETRKIFHDDSLKVTATTVRVPVLYSHSESINVELENNFDIKDIFQLYKNKKGIVLKDDIENSIYPMPVNSSNLDGVFIGRIRRDFSIDNGLNLWVVSDNIRKGAALNAVQIAEYIIEQQK